jgi:guanyl-specific ribonuclease Sa
MRRNFKMTRLYKILLILAVLLLSFVVTLENYQPCKVITVQASDSGIKLTKTKATLYPGETLQLKLTGTNNKIKWSSAKSAVATVKSGKVTAVAAGKTTIKAVCNRKSYKCKITVKEKKITIEESGEYTSKDEVALYIHTYHKLPVNYVSKEKVIALGWVGGSLEGYAPGKSIGGDYFGNFEGLLPSEDGRSYIECDIDTLGAESRGAKRIVYSNDGLIYYTEDHYESFTLLYNGW